jgi:ribonucleoside-triphosphate reductase
MKLSNKDVPWGEIGYITFKRTYARKLNEGKSGSETEEFSDVVEREIHACDKQLGVGFTKEEEELYRQSRMQLKWSVAGRFMWQLGTKTVDKLGLPSLQNCAGVVVDSPIRPFTWTFEMLMLGSGVGYNIQKEYVYQLPKLKKKVKIERIDEKDADFIVPDTREGWVKLLGKVLKSHFYSGEGFTYSVQLVRSKGAPIKGFGGVASGPEELCWGIDEISKILNKRSNQKLRPIDCLDIMNIIGFIVVSGNVRRSAQIAIGDYDDIEFLQAKSWNLGNIPKWRGMSNNSVACDDVAKLPQEFWDTYQEGEPYGLINLELSKKVGRTGETQYPDPDVVVFNPCAEQSLNNYETCCLSEVFLPNIDSYDEFLEVLKLTYRVNKHSLALKCSLKETESIVNANMRMGIGVTGVLQSSKEQISWLKKAYNYLREYDKNYSAAKGFPESIKLTTIKPSGTLSLLAGVTPGVHPNPAGPYYIRRVRIAKNSNLIQVCNKHGYYMEPAKNIDGSIDTSTMVVEFPCKVPKGTPVAADYTWKEQLEMVRKMQAEWSDNSVSCTVYYKKEDLPDIKEYLKENYKDNFKTLSFLLYHGHGFVQAPYETIDKATYDKMVSKTTPITSVEVSEEDFNVLDCEDGSCPIK